MERTQWVNAFFSPAGTTQRTAEAVATGSGCTIRSIDLSAPTEEEKIDNGTIFLAAVPVYGGRVPSLAIKRLSRIKGNGTPAVAVVVYGNRAYEDALRELKDTLTANGFLVIAAGAFSAQHSIVPSIAAGRPDGDDLKKATQLGAAARKKAEQEDFCPVDIPGNFPYKEASPSTMFPAANENCLQCGTCAALCPAQAIPPERPDQTDHSKCICCMRCIKVCPVHARSLPQTILDNVTAMLNAVASDRKMPELFL